MTPSHQSIALTLGLSILLGGCATPPEKPTNINAAAEPAKVTMNDYPTRDRVEYVLNCVAKHGGLSYINQYACGCKIDKIAEQMTFDEFDQARTFTMLYSTAGEKRRSISGSQAIQNIKGSI